MRKFKIGLVIALAVFVRFYNLSTSSHFLSDESRDLVNIHQIWVEKKLTLVGPISDDRSHVYSALTYYMLLPFAAGFNFDPLGTVVGASVWGMLTWAVLVALISKINSKWTLWGATLLAVWYPLVEISRWPWNPNFVPLWIGLGLLLVLLDTRKALLAGGVALGLAVHHHYLSILPIGLMVFRKRGVFVVAGILLALLPFVIFDMRHPPGIFIGRTIEYNRASVNTSLGSLITKFPEVVKYFCGYVFRVKSVASFGMVCAGGLIIWDFWKRSAGRKWLILGMCTLAPLVLYSAQFHYLLPAIPFFLAWIVTHRDGWAGTLAKTVVVLAMTGSILSLSNLWHQPDWSGDLRIVRGGSQIIAEQIRKQKLINPNVAVLGSPDIYPSGKKYRDLLLVNEIRVRAYEEYEFSDNLFVVTKADEETLRDDPAAELAYFKDGPIVGIWEIPSTSWRVMQFNRY